MLKMKMKKMKLLLHIAHKIGSAKSLFSFENNVDYDKVYLDKNII